MLLAPLNINIYLPSTDYDTHDPRQNPLLVTASPPKSLPLVKRLT